MVKKFICFNVIFIFIICLCGCTDLLLDNQADSNWLVKQSGKIAIYYRPINFSKTPSPSSSLVDTMLINQNYLYTRILDTLKAKFSGVVMIYLYNYDESKEKINTNGGGFGITQLLTYHYTYFYQYNNPILILGKKSRLGAHELVHVLAENVIGTHGTKLFSEGLAVYIDDTYGGKYIEDIMKPFYHSGNVLSLNSLINNSDADEGIYYPNAGTFIKFFVSKYGIEKAKILYLTEKENMESAMLNLTGKSLIDIQKYYEEYCKINFSG